MEIKIQGKYPLETFHGGDNLVRLEVQGDFVGLVESAIVLADILSPGYRVKVIDNGAVKFRCDSDGEVVQFSPDVYVDPKVENLAWYDFKLVKDGERYAVELDIADGQGEQGEK